MSNDGPYKNVPVRSSSNDKFTEYAAKKRAVEELKNNPPPQHKTPFKPISANRDLDLVTANLKAASDANRRAGSPANAAPLNLPMFDLDALAKATVTWLTNTIAGQSFHIGDTEVDRFNDTSLTEAVQHHLKVGWAVGVELIDTSYFWARDNNHLDLRRRDAMGNIVTIRGQSSREPTPVSHCVWPDEQALLARKEVEQVFAAERAEKARLKKLSDAELKKLATKDRTHPKAGQPGWGGIL
jgi:hypothetical protein